MGKMEKEAVMKKEKAEKEWRRLSEEVIKGVSEWREKHPKDGAHSRGLSITHFEIERDSM